MARFFCNGEPIERVESFVYLGSAIRLYGDVTEEVKIDNRQSSWHLPKSE
jgi:hypothetical protein